MNVHTPGPWIALESDPSEGFECIWIKAQPNPALRGFTKELGAVNGPVNDETRANARLIAAAPELLEALKLLMREVELSGNATAPDYGWPAAVEATKAAIAKAEGRA